MPNQTPKQNSIADQFSDEEMSQIQRHGAAQMGDPSFSEEVERNLQRREANAAKMHAAQTGGGDSDLGPTQMQTQQANQTNKLQQQSATQGQVKAQQAQSQMAPIEAPQAPGSAVGQSAPYPAQAGPQPQAPVQPPPPIPQPPGPGGPPGAPPEEGEED